PGRNYAPLQNGEQWLARVRGRDRVAPAPLDAAAPTPPADWSDVYVTDLEFLIHNPYAFYCRHLLRLKHAPDPWDDTTAIDFGNLVHDAIEQLTVNSERLTVNDIVNVLDEKAKDKLEPGSVMFHFWHKRFAEMAPIIKDFIDEISADDVVWSAAENEARGELQIENRTIRAKADRVYLTKDKTGVVVDIKTGALPSNAQLNDGMMPQLPLEALMLSSGKFKGQSILPARVIMKFLSLARGKCGMVEYDGDDLNTKMDAATQKTKEQFDQFSAGGAPYVYRETTIKKYRDYDDLARVDD
ncbi:MAG: PD-(D/E)XK nuclease family protein, partial [Proteobacteria bacterium]|nr:PD-(D/E)XK nuclease family protein [Pseudomonadota bacterium]